MGRSRGRAFAVVSMVLVGLLAPVSMAAATGDDGGLSGVVLAEDTGLPLEGICVSAEGANTYAWASTTTGADGGYELSGLPADDYYVGFRDCLNGIYAAEEYDDHHPPEGEQTSVAVQAGSTTSGVNASLSVGGHISGTVTADDTGLPLEGMCVTAYDAWKYNFGVATTDSDGHYEIVGLATRSDYAVYFKDCSGGGYLNEWFDDVPWYGSDGVESPRRLAVEAGSTTTGIDAGLAPGGRISGTVTADDTGLPLEDICVDAQRGDEGLEFLEEARTGPDGSYEIRSLYPFDDYRLEFKDCSGAGYIGEFFDDAATLEDSTGVTVEGTATTSGVDAALAPPGRITGTVTDEDTGLPLEGICVRAYVPWSPRWPAWATTGPDGAYEIVGLAADDNYRVVFADCPNSSLNDSGYIPEFFDNATFEGSTPVIVTAGQTTGPIDASLALGGRVTGTVTDQDTGLPLEGICVFVGDGRSSTNTGPDGTFDFGALPTGDYLVKFDDCGGSGYAGEFYDDAYDPANATRVEVTEGETTPGIDAALAQGGHITGTITADQTGEPLEDICIQVWDPQTNFGGGGSTGPDGSYDIAGLTTGDNYLVRFAGCSGGGEYYDNATDIADATRVSVTNGMTTRGIDAGLPTGGGEDPGDATAPTVDLRTPADGATFSQDQPVYADYSCTDEPEGSGLDRCNGSIEHGAPIDTSTAGTFGITVTGTDNAGNTTEVTHTYTVTENPPPPAANTLRVKNQLRGDVPDVAMFLIRVRCFAADGSIDERVLRFDNNTFLDIDIPADHPRCRVREIDNGGATSTRYRATSATAQATTRARAAWITFGANGGEEATIVVTNHFPGSCPRPGPRYC